MIIVTLFSIVLLAVAVALAAKQVRLTYNMYLIAKLRPSILRHCLDVIEDKEESQEGRLFAYKMFMLGLNQEQILALVRFADLQKAHPDRHENARMKPENKASIEEAIKGISMMMLALHPKYGPRTRHFLRSLKIRASSEESNSGGLKAPPTEIKKHRKEMAEIVCVSASSRTMATNGI